MKVQELMSENPSIITSQTSIREAAQKMKELDCGFLPVGDNDRLQGVITDRDIVLRVVAEGKDVNQCKASECLTNRVLYCFQDDDIESAAESMKDQQVCRLIVLNNRDEKRLCGIITLGDIARESHDDRLVGETSECIKKAA